MLNRRRTLQAMATMWPLAASISRAGEPVPVFRHGVASGDPTPRSTVIWTRVSGQLSPVNVHWQVATDDSFTKVLAEGTVLTGPERDFTVKAVPSGLQPAQVYHYRFLIDGTISPIGRTRTLPVGPVQHLGLAVASCSNYCFGYFNAYDAIARGRDIHFVLHTGDYLYEYGADEWGGAEGHRLGRAHLPTHEIVSLADYRQRHAQYRLDAGAQAMHAAHPFIAMWDDHEVANNPWTGGAQNHQNNTEGDWIDRRTNALRAWYEWMPVRDPVNGAPAEAYWRAFEFGDLATLLCMETRHTARAEQIDYARHSAQITDLPSRQRFIEEILGAPDRRMISAAQEAWMDTALRRSIDQGQPWRLFGNAIPMARMPVPDLSSLPFVAGRSQLADIGELLWKSRWNLPWYTDTWDGYPWARERFYERCAAAGVHDIVMLTGDSHAFWFNRLRDGRGNSAGVELGTSGITSPGDFLDLGFDRNEAEALDRQMAAGIDEVLWTDSRHNGFLRVDLTADVLDARCFGVDTIERPNYRTDLLKHARVTKRRGRLDLHIL